MGIEVCVLKCVIEIVVVVWVNLMVDFRGIFCNKLVINVLLKVLFVVVVFVVFIIKLGICCLWLFWFSYIFFELRVIIIILMFL